MRGNRVLAVRTLVLAAIVRVNIAVDLVLRAIAVVHRANERLATTAAASTTTLPPLAAPTLPLAVAGLAFEIRLAVTAELPRLAVLLVRLLSPRALHLLAVAAALLAATPPSATSTAASGVRVSIL
jgi:di/tricarboxylate transporter